jgi:lipopolysaccharide biosynthesis regulator YciM
MQVLITDEMAEAMTPPKEAAISPQQRQQVLLSIAQVATRQGSYHLACKKYTQVRRAGSAVIPTITTACLQQKYSL